jgi:glutamate N-acetyltransferase/amino-acid N-acetyltransferase
MRNCFRHCNRFFFARGLMASGKSSLPEITVGSEAMQQFQQAIQEACAHLAEAIIRDGEGATKLIKIKVQQAASEEEAVAVAKTIAHSTR